MILACDGFCQSMSSEPQTLLLNLEKMVVEEMIKFLVSFFNWSPKLLFGYGWIQIYPLSCCTSIDVILKYGWLFLVSWVWSLIFLTCLLTYFFFFFLSNMLLGSTRHCQVGSYSQRVGMYYWTGQVLMNRTRQISWTSTGSPPLATPAKMSFVKDPR